MHSGAESQHQILLVAAKQSLMDNGKHTIVTRREYQYKIDSYTSDQEPTGTFHSASFVEYRDS